MGLVWMDGIHGMSTRGMALTVARARLLLSSSLGVVRVPPSLPPSLTGIVQSQFHHNNA